MRARRGRSRLHNAGLVALVTVAFVVVQAGQGLQVARGLVALLPELQVPFRQP